MDKNAVVLSHICKGNKVKSDFLFIVNHSCSVIVYTYLIYILSLQEKYRFYEGFFFTLRHLLPIDSNTLPVLAAEM